MAFWDMSIGGKNAANKADKDVAAPSASETRIAELTAEIERLNRTCHTLEQQNNAYKSIEAGLQATVNQLRHDYAEIKPRYDRYCARYGELPKGITLPEVELEDGETEESESYQAQVRIRALSDECYKLQEALKQLDVTHTEQQANTAVFEEQLGALKTQLVTEKQQNETLQKDKAVLVEQLGIAKRAFTSLRQRVEAQIKRDKESQADKPTEGIDIETLQQRDAQISDLTAHISQLNTDNTALLLEKQQLNERISTMTESLETAKIACNNAETKAATLEQQLVDLQADMQRMQQENDAMLENEQQQSEEIQRLKEQGIKDAEALKQAADRIKELEKFEEMARTIAAMMNK